MWVLQCIYVSILRNDNRIRNISSTKILIYVPDDLEEHILHRIKRQQQQQQQDGDKNKKEDYETEICKDRDAGEWFRISPKEDDSCRDVIQCTSSVRIMFCFIICQLRVGLVSESELVPTYL